MRYHLLLACIGLALASPAHAAEPPPTPPVPLGPIFGGADGLFAAPPVRREPAPAAEAPPAPAWDDTGVRVDVVLGLPTALRLQCRLGDTRTWIEGGAAIYTVLPSVFLGLRADRLLNRSATDGLVVRPGIDVYYVPVYGKDWLFGDYRSGVAVVAADFDMTWQHRWSERTCGTVGLKLGCGIGATNSALFPVPILGATLGLQF